VVRAGHHPKHPAPLLPCLPASLAAARPPPPKDAFFVETLLLLSTRPRLCGCLAMVCARAAATTGACCLPGTAAPPPLAKSAPHALPYSQSTEPLLTHLQKFTATHLAKPRARWRVVLVHIHRWRGCGASAWCSTLQTILSRVASRTLPVISACSKIIPGSSSGLCKAGVWAQREAQEPCCQRLSWPAHEAC